MRRSGHGPRAGWREAARGPGLKPPVARALGAVLRAVRTAPAACRPPAPAGSAAGPPAPECVEPESPFLLSLCFPTRALSVSLTIWAGVHWSVQPVGVADSHSRKAARPRVREPRQGDDATRGCGAGGIVGPVPVAPVGFVAPVTLCLMQAEMHREGQGQGPRVRDCSDLP